MLVCRSAKHPKIWGTLSAIFSIPWRPLTSLFSALVFQSSTHQTSATCGPSALPSGANSPDVVAALPPQKRVLRGAAQAWCGSSQAQALPVGMREAFRFLSVCFALGCTIFATRRTFSSNFVSQTSTSPAGSVGAFPRALQLPRRQGPGTNEDESALIFQLVSAWLITFGGFALSPGSIVNLVSSLR